MRPGLRIVGASIAGRPEEGLVDLKVKDSMITSISRSDTVPGPDDIDARGLFLFPGLIDAHVHLCFSPDQHPETDLPDRDADLFDVVRANGRETLTHGVTTVRDLGSRGDVVRRYAEQVDSGAIIGPQVLVAGPVLTRVNGHCYYVGTSILTGADPIDAVRTVDRAGDPWVKTMVTGGALTSTSSPETLQFDLAEMRAVVGAAHELGKRVAAHALTREGCAIAVAAGIDTLEHGVDADEMTLSEMCERSTALVPVLSPSARTLARDPVGNDEHAARLREIVGRLRESTAHAVRLGVPVLAGTDAGCPDVPHGAALVDELALLEAAGMNRASTLHAATAGAANAFGLTNIGQIAVGYRADLLLLDADPFDDLDALRRPTTVIAAGRIASLESTTLEGSTLR